MNRTDAELLGAARNDPQAFREFYDRYAVWVRVWFARQTGSESAALDLTAETFAQAWHSLRRFRDLADGSGAPVAVRHRPQPAAPVPQAQPHRDRRARSGSGSPALAEGDEYEAVDERVAARSLAPALAAAVRLLPPDQRARPRAARRAAARLRGGGRPARDQPERGSPARLARAAGPHRRAPGAPDDAPVGPRDARQPPGGRGAARRAPPGAAPGDLNASAASSTRSARWRSRCRSRSRSPRPRARL